ncbi:hypothetical protein C8J55DRAFT_162300 [Lentinula edodes]|uniref:Uncharacterized protein n=1 Tax=Lentinula lateritia TaxID=40482 RepID=A0A9W9AYI3_9AGAR|nr:hypothetical protein C8J55DRAFT_162300 [Lentinula edodes]
MESIRTFSSSAPVLTLTSSSSSDSKTVDSSGFTTHTLTSTSSSTQTISFTVASYTSPSAAPSLSDTLSSFSYTPSLKHTSSIISSSSTLPPKPSPSLAPNTRFASNTGTIIGATIGGTVALIAATFVAFLICGRIRRNRTSQSIAGRRTGTQGFGPTAGDSTEEMAEQGGAPLSATRKLGILARAVSGGSSSRPLNRTISSLSTAAWRSPLSDEDGDFGNPAAQVPSPVSTSITPGYGFGESSSSGHGLDVGRSSSHGHHSGSVESSGSTYNASSIQSSRSQGFNMPGFGQAAETMRMGPPMSAKDVSSHGHSTLLNQDHSHSTGTISSMKLNTSNNHATNSAGEGSGSSNSHSHSITPGALSETTASAQALSIAIPKLKINDHSVPPSRPSSPKSFKKGLIERLRGGRSSTQGSSSTQVPTPASSSYYPSYPTRSSLLNPPLPLPDAPLEPPVMPFLQPPLPLPSPALTDDSRMDYTDGLLNPVHSARLGEAGIHVGSSIGNNSSLSLGDHVDYSRPFGGFVFNRMDSSTTFTSADTRMTQPAAETPALQHPTARLAHFETESIATLDAVGDGGRDSYFPPG